MRTSRPAAAGSYAALLLLVLFVCVPLLIMVFASLEPAQDLFSFPPKFFPRGLTLQSYGDVLFRTEAPRWFLNSFIVAAGTMVVNMVIALMAAFSSSRFKFRGRGLISFASLSTYIFPPIVLLVPLYTLLNSAGLTNSLIGDIVPHCLLTLPFSLWLLKAYLDAIPLELDEAARVDGASYFRTFVSIIIPLAGPGVLSTGLLAFITSWSEFLFSSVLLVNTDKQTLPVGIAGFITGFDVEWGDIMALATLTTVPIVIFFAIIQKWFVAGILSGGLKG